MKSRAATPGHSAGAWTPGVGIASMRERVEQLGGTLSLRADPDGATVTAEFPISGPRTVAGDYAGRSVS
jgi:signal transduction histidine kinase